MHSPRSQQRVSNFQRAMQALQDGASLQSTAQMLLDNITQHYFPAFQQLQHKPGSDIDLALSGAALDERELGRIADEIDDLLLPYTLDLCHLAAIDNPDLLAHIRDEGQTIFTRTA